MAVQFRNLHISHIGAQTSMNDKIDLMCIYDLGMRDYLGALKTELLSPTGRALEKFRRMNEEKYAKLNLFLNFNDEI